MAVTIGTPVSASATQTIALGGKTYEFVYSLNSRDNRVRLDISFDDSPIITGVKLMENESLLQRYDLVEFSHGDLFCIRVLKTDEEVTLENLGIGKPYELMYLTNDEITTLRG